MTMRRRPSPLLWRVGAALVGALGVIAPAWCAGADEPAVPFPIPVGGADSSVGAAPPAERLVAEALADNPSLAALRERLAGAREMIAPAGALADPMLEPMYTEAGFPGYTVGTDPMSMIGIEVRQALPYPGKRDARSRIAAAEVATREAGLEALRREISREVRILYARLYALDQEIANLGPGRELLDLVTATTSARYGAGEGSQEGVIKAQLLKSKLGERETDLVARRRALVAAVGGLLGRTDAFTLGRVAALETPAFPVSDWAALAASGSAGIEARQRSIEEAERRLEARRLDLKPDFSAAASTSYRGSLDPVVTLKFGFELPLWRRGKQEPLIRAAVHEVEAARRDLQTEEVATMEAVQRLLASEDGARMQITRYREAILPLTAGAFEAARSEYLAGRGDFSTLIDDLSLWLDSRTELARREGELYSAWAELQALVSPAPDDPPGGHSS